METQIIQVIMGMLGTIGFSILFHVKGKKLIAIALGGALSWVVYLLVLGYSGNKAAGLLVSTFALGVLAEIFARAFKAPVISFQVPMLIPRIAGGDLYYTTDFFVRRRGAEFTDRLNLLLWEAGAIAFGIILAACVMHIPHKSLVKYLERKRS